MSKANITGNNFVWNSWSNGVSNTHMQNCINCGANQIERGGCAYCGTGQRPKSKVEVPKKVISK